MKSIIFNLLYSIHLIRPSKGVYHYKIHPFIVSFKSVKRATDFVMDIYHSWYDFDALLYWRDSEWRLTPRNVWNSYFDFGLNCVVDSPSMLHKKEAMGYTKMSFDEAEREAKKYRKQAKAELRAKIRRGAEEAYSDMKQGRSFHSEILEQIPKHDRERAERMRAYGR